MLSRIDSRSVVDALAPMAEAEVRRMEILFEQHDRDRDGVICLEEFGQLMDEAAVRSGGRPPAAMRVRHIFGSADLNHNGEDAHTQTAGCDPTLARTQPRPRPPPLLSRWPALCGGGRPPAL
eukprot:1226100-Prymnesium_polylepis.1